MFGKLGIFFDYVVHQLRTVFGTVYNRIVTALIIISLGCAFGIWQSQSALTQFKQDTKERRSESCLRDEEEYLQKVKAVKETYRYLEELKPNEVGSTLNQFIIRNVPQTVNDAKNSFPASFCSEDGIGLDKEMPEVPTVRDYSYLLQGRGN